MRTSGLLLLPLLLLGCETDAAEPSAPDPRPLAATPLPDDAVPDFLVSPLAGPARPDARPWPTPGDTVGRRLFMEDMMAKAQAEAEFLAAFNDAASWEAAHRLVQDATPDGDYPSHKLAVRMLNRHLLRAPDTVEAAQALGWYTQALLAQGSPEGSLILRALRRLDGYWEETRRQQAAKGAANRLGAVFAEVAGCVGCSVEEALAAMWPQRRMSSEDRLYEMQAVHQQLMALAYEGTPMP